MVLVLNFSRPSLPSFTVTNGSLLPEKKIALSNAALTIPSGLIVILSRKVPGLGAMCCNQSERRNHVQNQNQLRCDRHVPALLLIAWFCFRVLIGLYYCLLNCAGLRDLSLILNGSHYKTRANWIRNITEPVAALLRHLPGTDQRRGSIQLQVYSATRYVFVSEWFNLGKHRSRWNVPSITWLEMKIFEFTPS